MSIQSKSPEKDDNAGVDTKFLEAIEAIRKAAAILAEPKVKEAITAIQDAAKAVATVQDVVKAVAVQDAVKGVAVQDAVKAVAIQDAVKAVAIQSGMDPVAAIRPIIAEEVEKALKAARDASRPAGTK